MASLGVAVGVLACHRAGVAGRGPLLPEHDQVHGWNTDRVDPEQQTFFKLKLVKTLWA